MSTSSIRPEKFGFFTSSSRPGVLVADLTPASSNLKDDVASKKLTQISQREGEDAVLTGGTRSLSRRLLALNLAEFDSQPVPAMRGRPPLSA